MKSVSPFPNYPRYMALICLFLLIAGQSLWAAPAEKKVEVINGIDSPVPTFDVDGPVIQPVHYECVGTVPDGLAISGDVVPAIDCLEAQVPTDKELVIEFVTARILVPSGQTAGLLIGTSTQGFPSGSTGIDHQISLDLLTGAGTDSFITSQPVKLYSSNNSFVEIIVTRHQNVGNMIFDVTWSGYLVDVN